MSDSRRIKPSAQAAQSADISASDSYQELKFRIFQIVLENLDRRGLTSDTIGRNLLQEEVSKALQVAMATGEGGGALNSAERIRLILDVLNEIVGFGPLDPLLADPTIDDIIVNGPLNVYVERQGQLSKAPVRFRDADHLMNIIQRMISPVGRRVDEASPFVDARLPDGSRLNVVIPPVALDGPMVSIRKFRTQAMMAGDFVRRESLSREMLDFLTAAVRSRLNILICGGTGSGKTTLLNMLSAFIGETERLITIEDAAELQLRQTHVVRMETRPPSQDGAREVTARDVVRNALRMRPDRIILGEVRGAEAVDMLQAMSTGHDGSMATMHSNSTRDALSRLELLLGFGGLNSASAALRRYVANSIQIIVQVQRLSGGQRKVTSISEVTGIEGENYSINELFRFEEKPPLSGRGAFVATASRPFFAHRLVWGAGSAKP